ncbi:abnormal spindle-like microcephaly-associated protein [Grus japonensis]|uniref:Abnormal spindle-like microcephaly-associated protein n=1 Tax=Grus japonensis TaxID=30415 RepID=A0ABC9X5B3_GRUJA
MAAGFFSGAAAWEPSAVATPRRRRWAGRRGEDDADEGPAVLVLSHFSRPPFLSFGSLRVGASRTRLLGIDNPNAEDAEVVVDRFPASARGFSLEHHRFFVQSGQRIFVSVTWTPLEEGKVRELVTFVINGIVKHQAVILGVAEQPLKKKKSLWDTIKKKNSSETSTSIKVKKSTSEVKNVNKTFHVSQRMDRLRSPLQPCENQNTMQNSISPGNDSLVGSENKLPISPISPMLEEPRNTVCTPLAMRRSTTFSDIAAAVNEKLLPEIDSYNVKKCVNEHNELKSESAYSSPGLAQLQISNDEIILHHTLSPVCTPEHSASVPALSTRRFLSPDSFVNDSYQVDIDIIEQPVSILSPDQFVKDSLSDKQSMTPKLEAALISSTTETYVVKKFLPSKLKKNGDVETRTHVHIEHKLNEVFEMHNVESQVLRYDKSKENHFSFPSTEEVQTHNFSQREQPKKRPVLSATVIKNKPDTAEEKRMETLQPKSKKCLSKAIMECANVVPVHTKPEITKHFPVIGPVSAKSQCHNDKVSSSPTGSTSLCRKRKSEIYVENSRVTAPVCVEEVERKRTLTSSVENKTHATRRPSAFKPTNRERVGQRKKAGSSLQKVSKTTNRISKPIPGLAQSHLMFVKPLKTVIPRHPMPFAAKNMFYDEHWKEKQQRGFTWWLNFVLTPDDFSVKANTSQVNAAALVLEEENHHKTSVRKAPTKDEASLKAYTAHRKLNKLRRAACRLFTSETMIKAIKKLEVEIETRRLLVRRDRHLWKDVGERQKVLNWLLSYNPLWLRIGLETVYGELIALESNSDVMGLAIFILNRLLWNPDIAAEYRHPTVPHLYREGHEEALSKFTLKKLLLLVCFLDCAKRSRMIEHDPCLFCKDAEFKASKDLLLAFSRDFLSGEGDLSRHLGFLGLPVSHVQTPLDEFDFAVTNLAVDLQCGIRLVRTMELLTKNWNLSKQLRVPAISRLQKIHNVDIVLNVLKERGIHLKDDSGASIDSRDIVDRHRERTLALLWKIVFAFQVDVFLNVEQLKEEIEFLKNAHKRKTQWSALKTFPHGCRVQEDNSCNSLPQCYSENVKLLMAWVNAVCEFYNIKVENFTVCFSDGRVLCHLIHHYHPCYVPLEAVCQRTTQTVECSRTHTAGLNSSSSSSSESDTSLNVMEGMVDQTVTASVLYKELLDNERKNFQLINAAVSDLGGIPAMIHHSDMSNTIPDEKVVITYVSFLCSRLLDLRQETRAARLIQSAWRNYRLKRELKLSQERDRAAQIIQKSAINFLSRQRILKKVNAAVFIQKHWRRYLARTIFLNLQKTKLEEARSKSATVIQAYWRRYSARKRFLQLRHYVIFVQARIRMSAYRGFVVRRRMQQMHQAATVIQAALRMRKTYISYQAVRLASVIIQQQYRAYREGKRVREIYLKLYNSVIVLQAAWRGMKTRSLLKKRHEAALMIQRNYRMYREYCRYRKVQWATQLIQRRYRANSLKKIAVQHYVSLKKAATCIQKAFRVMQARKQHQEMHCAAIVVQKNFKAFRERQRYLSLKAAALVFQRRYRALILSRQHALEYLSLRRATVRIQAVYRGIRVRRSIEHMHLAASTIQSAYKMYRNRRSYQNKRTAAIIIQNYYRSHIKGKNQRKKYLTMKNSALVIQASYRGMRERQKLKIMHASAIVIQSSYRMYVQHRYYTQLRWAVRVTQQRFRAKMATEADMENYAKIKKAVICLQSAFRAKKSRHLYKTNVAAQCIQSFLQMRVERRRFLEKKAAAITIQSMFRCQRTRARYKLIQSSAVAIQSWYRACHRARLQKAEYSAQRQAVVIIQSAFRGMKARKTARQIRAARKIQSFLQMAVQRRKFIQLRRAAITLRAYYLMHKTESQYTSYKKAALVLQRYYRSHLTVKYQRTTYLQSRRNIIIVQARVRGFIEKRRFHKIKESTIKIQAFFRGFSQRQKYLQCKFSAVLIQQHYRAHQMRNTEQQRYHQMKRAAIRIQASYRGYKARQWVNKMRAAQVIQAWFRGCRARKEYASVVKAIRVIQSHFKTKQQRTWFLKMKFCALTIQRRWRATLTARMIQHQFLATKNAAVKIQLAYRQYRARRLLRKKLQAACLIQKTYRGFKARRKLAQQKAAAVIIQKHLRAWREGRLQLLKYNETRRAVVKLQAFIRGYLVRKKITEQKQKKRLLYFTAAAYHHISAIKIQRAYRIHLILKLAQNQISSVLIIQKWFRAKMQQKRFLRDYQRIIQLQRVIRGWLKHRNDAATIIQRNVQRFLVCRRRRKFAVGIIKFQALWRGYSWRKSNDTAKTKALRHGLEKANEKSREENKLCNRTAIAIEYLLKYKHLSYILAALKHLEVATRLSPLCCENMAQSRAIFTIFVLIRSCNRSVPCMDVIRYSIQVLLNVSKYERTTEAVYEVENSIDTLLDLLQMYRGKAGDRISEKGGSIFTKTCCLLAILSKDSKRALEIRNIPRAVSCIQSLYKLTARKHKMDAERTLVKQKTNTLLSGTSFVPVTPLRIKTVSRIKPDWVLRKDNMQEIVDPLQAILMVMDTLGIACY